MITRCYTFLPGVSSKTQSKIHGDWSHFLQVKRVPGISIKRKLLYDRMLMEAIDAYKNRNSSYFVKAFPPSEHWRLWELFKDSALFLDIEIAKRNDILVIGVSDGEYNKTLVKGFTLDKQELQNILSRCSLLITFNGSSFDIPILERFFGTTLNIPHIDLKHLCAKVGLIGGLKEIEKQVGISRPTHLIGSPTDAWRAYIASGDAEYLELIVEYNKWDCQSLYEIMKICYQKRTNNLY